MAYGFKAIKAHDFELIYSSYGKNAKNQFDFKVLEEGWLSANDIT